MNRRKKKKMMKVYLELVEITSIRDYEMTWIRKHQTITENTH